MLKQIQQWDNQISGYVQTHMHTPLLDRVMPMVTHLGDLGIVWGIWGLVLFFVRKYRVDGVLLLGSIALCAVLCNLIFKPLFSRSRPFELTPEEEELLIDAPTDRSFPSGHTMASFTAVVLLWGIAPMMGAAALLLGIVIGFSRIYLFVHHPSDVVAGAAFGALLGKLCVSWGYPTADFFAQIANRILFAGA